MSNQSNPPTSAQPRKALGKGLASLIPERRTPVTMPAVPHAASPAATIHVTASGDIKKLRLSDILPNKYQPRNTFSESELQDLAASIKAHGILQPLLVTPSGAGRYELIAGERRWRAAKLAGLLTVPVISRDVTPQERLELAIIENVQREDLNPIEEAQSYKALMDQFNYSQDDVAKKVGKSRSTVANSLRLLYLPQLIREDVEKGRLSSSHARALAAIDSIEEQLQLREKILDSELNVREIERLIQARSAAAKPRSAATKTAVSLTPQLKKVVEEMMMALGTKVKIKPRRNQKGGEVTIEYYNVQDLDRIYSCITKKSDL